MVDRSGRRGEGAPADGTRREFLKAGAGGACALCLAGLFGASRAWGQESRRGLIGRRESPWFRQLTGTTLECELCPRRCRIASGGRGACRARENRNGRGYTLTYGNPCLVQFEPVERLPFYHVLPGSRSLCLTTAGCPLACRFCEVWDVALVAPEDVHAYDLPPRAVIDHALRAGASSVSYAFGEPIAFYEYMTDTADLARQAGLRNLVHTSGYIEGAPLRELLPRVDAVNVDLKGFDASFYRRICDGELAPVLDTLGLLAGRGVHTEITNIVIPTLNDDTAMIGSMCRWIVAELGTGVPLHFARFYPLYKLANLPPTPVATLDRARSIALDAGLEYVYIGRVTGHEAESTYCPACRATAIGRLGFMIEAVELTDGRCDRCGHAIPGLWA